MTDAQVRAGAAGQWRLCVSRMGEDQQTLAGAIDQFVRDGFTANLSVVGNRLRGAATQTTFGAEDIVIRDYRRFEGISDPDDMAIVYAIEAKGGVRGTLVDAYGVYSDPAISAFLGPEIGR